jgi:predicted RNase H-like HicB family nuclease
MELREKAEKLAKRPYFLMTSVEETTDGQQIYFARVLEIEGCFGQGETREQAIDDLRLAMVDFIQSLLEDGLTIPEPSTLVNTTVGTTAGTTAGTTLTYIGKGKRFRREQNLAYKDAYILSIPSPR